MAWSRSPHTQEHLNEQFYELTRYPEPDASSLKKIACPLLRGGGGEYSGYERFHHSILSAGANLKGAKSAIAVPSFCGV